MVSDKLYDEKVLNRAIVYAYDTLKDFAPDEEAKKRVDIYDKEVKLIWGDDKKEILKCLVGSIMDGLLYGNWLWLRPYKWGK